MKEGGKEGGGESKKDEKKRKGGREIRKSKEEKRKLFLSPLRSSLGGWLALPVAVFLFADSGYTCPLRLVVCKARETNQDHHFLPPSLPNKSVEVTARSFTHLLSLAVINSLHLGTGQRP